VVVQPASLARDVDESAWLPCCRLLRHFTLVGEAHHLVHSHSTVFSVKSPLTNRLSKTLLVLCLNLLRTSRFCYFY